MKFDRSKYGNRLINVLAIGVLLAAIYAAFKYIIIPVCRFLWASLTNAVTAGYQQGLEFAETFMQWDMALYLLLGLSLYLLPTIIAYKKRHPSKRTIFIIDLVFGWSVIGWVLALVMCLSSVEPGESQQ